MDRSRCSGIVLVVTLCLVLTPASASAEPYEVDSHHMSEIVQWVYRNGALEAPSSYSCSEACGHLWAAEEGTRVTLGNVETFWHEVGELLLGSGLWGGMSKFRLSLSGGSGSRTQLHEKVSTLLWKIYGKASKQIALPMPASPQIIPLDGCADGWAKLLLAGEDWSPEGPEAKEKQWVAEACGASGTTIRSYENSPPEAEAHCISDVDESLVIAVSEPFDEWTEESWRYNKCMVPVKHGGLAEAPQTVQALYVPFRFGRPEDAGSGTAEAETYPEGESSPEPASVRLWTEVYVAAHERLARWLSWFFSGEHGPSPGEVSTPTPEEEFGAHNPSTPGRPGSFCGEAVNCATGNETQSQTDLSVGGRGPELDLTRTYNSQLAVSQATAGSFGFGWTGSYSAHTEEDPETGVRTVYTDDGSAVQFTKSGGHWVPTSPLVQSALAEESEGFTFTLPDQTVLRFANAGYLTSETDRNGNTLTMTRSGEGRLESVSDAAGRKLSFAYNGSGEVESATDPMGHTVKYTYEGGNLMSVTEPGETSPRWRFKYNGEHELTADTDGRGETVEREYDSSHRVISETDALHRKRTWEYSGDFGEEGETTTITNPSGAVTRKVFDWLGLPVAITSGYGTSLAASTDYGYDADGHLLSLTDPDGHTTTYTYDSAGDRTSEKNADGDETQWTYDSTHDVLSQTRPNGEKTTIERDSHGNATEVSRPAPGSATQATKYKYDSHGDLESVTDPLGHTWKYEYDGDGDRVAETDPEGDKRTWAYNEDSREVSMVAPRGNVSGGEPSRFMTTIERDGQGRATLVSEPEHSEAGRPVSRGVVSVSGSPQEGQTLAAGVGVWGGASSLSYAYQWRLCNASGEGCSNISGATSATLLLGAGEVGATVRVVVGATNSAGSAESSSPATAVVSAAEVFVSGFGSSGTGSGEFSHPMAEAWDAHGDLWVADGYNSRIEKFSPSGSWLATYGKPGTGHSEYEEPVGLAINQATGDVFIADQNNNRVQELNEKGEFIRAFGSSGTGNGQFDEPDGVTLDSKGNVWVTDFGNDRVQEFNEKGEYQSKFGAAGSGNGQFSGPNMVAFSGEHIYVTDNYNSRVQEFNEKGEYVSQFGSHGSADGQFSYPNGIATGPNGNLYVADSGNNRIQEFTPAGVFLATFGTHGSSNGQLSEPEYLTFNSAGEAAISDAGNNRIETWRPAGVPSNITPPSVSGALKEGQTLSVGTGVWSAAPAASYSYQWQHCNAAGGECSNISGATASSHALVGADVGSTLRALVTQTNSAGTASSTSAATGIVSGLASTRYSYDADGDLESVTDPDGHTTTYTYDADDEPTKVKEANGDSSETEYNSEGQVVAQTDGNKHTTKYTRNLLGEVTEVTDPLGHKTTREYDKSGNLTSLTDPAKRTTTYTYDPANQLTAVSYSDGKTPTVKYEYNVDGERTKMTDGTGETTYAYDQLDRLTQTKDGHGDTTAYEYNLANDPTKITYPNGKAITRAYDNDARLHSITDWLEHTTTFSYDPDSDLKATTFPSASGDEDTYAYDYADATNEVKMSKGSETLDSLTYTRDQDGQVTSTASKGLPGEEETTDSYDTDNRLTKAATTNYEYDAANNPTKIGSSSNAYNEADELTKTASASYEYNEPGQRTKTTPTSGPASSYGYDQAGNLTTVTRTKEGETPAIEDTYTFNGDGLRASQTTSGTTSYITWDLAQGLPLILNDGTNNYIYGPGGLPIEQINNSTSTVTYLHHDQAGSTRLLTGSTGTVTGKCTYAAYGTPTCEGTSTTPLGFDGEYTSSDTGLIYMRARVYDPATAQFLSVDPLEKLTRAPYNFAEDNPLNESDPTGLLGWSEIGQAVAVGLACVATDGGCVVAGLADLDANVISDDYKAATEPCKATEEETTSLTDLAGFGLGAGVGELAGGSLSEEAKKALEDTSAGKLALKQLVGLGATSSTLTTLAYAKEHENSSSGCSCQG
jgi:RHS repeat-associated protein